ncbi:MAG: aspartate aminotransferase family protein [Polyangiaceae bacterium]|nr:aspartate aminotransferase family protein [Polyangiaceae bacterium]MCB9609429.1 aspartate aminotransferase family protein [Polyangiaceae bacterium]
MVARTPQPYPDGAATFDASGQFVSPGKTRVFREYGLTLVMGERDGIGFRDAFTGEYFVNCHSNGGVFNLGHRNPALIACLRQALDEVDIGNHHLVSGWRALLAERLARSTGDHLTGVVFGVGGGEAIDLAIKVCRAATQRSRVISVHGGYHGHTGLALAAGDATFRDKVLCGDSHFEQVPFNDLEAMERALTDEVAAVLLEPIPATLGMPLPLPGYLEGVAALCRARGIKLIVDEVQTGLGRTGRLWGYQHHNFRPDVLVSGKGLSGGLYPISATLMTHELHQLFASDPFIHISTFGGSELGCRVALEVLNQVERPEFLRRVCEVGEQLEAGMAGLPFELRRRGLMMGLKFPVEGAGMLAMRLLVDQGLFVLYAGNDTSVVQFLPPLILQPDDADDVLRRLRAAFLG